MLTVITKTNPPTNTRGARITVKSNNFKTVFTGGMPGDTPREYHARAIDEHIQLRAIKRREELKGSGVTCNGYQIVSPQVFTPDCSGYVVIVEEV